MARVGRFGRLPTQAPDLSGQIVSMIEQYQNALDSNILDAWQNGGKFKGEKVTDRRILNWYRKRRDSYDKDDPEWDEWDNELWQMRFRVSNEKVMMQYRMGNIGEAAVARHYREWARKMPVKSSYYRNLMQSAGQFEQAASAGRAAASKAYDYEALMRRVRSHDDDVRAGERMFSIINDYARSYGFIEANETVFTTNTFEAADISSLMANVSEDQYWPQISEYLDKEYGFGGTLTWEKLERATNRAIRGKKAQIAEYKKAPGDWSSYITGLKNDIGDLQQIKTLDDRMAAYEKYVNAYNEWNEATMDGTDPSSVMQPDAAYIKKLKTIRQDLLDNGMTAEAGDVLMEIEALRGNVEAVQGTNNEALWQNGADETGGGSVGGSEIEELARNRASLIVGDQALKNGTAFLFVDSPKETDLAVSLGATQTQGFVVRPFDIDPATGKPRSPDESTMVIPVRSGNAIVSRVVAGVPMFDDKGNLLGYRAIHDNYALLKLRRPDDPTRWMYTDEDIFNGSVPGVRMEFANGQINVVSDAGFSYDDLRRNIIDRSATGLLDRLYGKVRHPDELGPDASPAEKAKAQQEWDARQTQTEALHDWESVGVPAGTDLPEVIAGVERGEGQDAVITSELEKLFPITSFSSQDFEDPQFAQKVAIRQWLREAEGARLDPIPGEENYIDLNTGEMKRRTANLSGEDIVALNTTNTLASGEPLPSQAEMFGQTAGAPVQASEPTTPTTGETQGPPAPGTTGVPAIDQTVPVTPTQPTPETAQPNIPTPANSWRDMAGDDSWWFDVTSSSQNLSRYLQEWLTFTEGKTNVYSSAGAVVVARANDTGRPFTEGEMASVLAVVDKDPSTDFIALAQTEQEMHDDIQLADLTPIAREAVKNGSRGDTELGQIGARFGATDRERVEIEKNGGWVGQYYDRTGLWNPTALGPPAPSQDPSSPEYVKPETFLPQSEKGLIFGNLFTRATGTDVDPASAPSPAAQTDPKVPTPGSQKFQAAKVNFLKLPTPTAPQVAPLPAGIAGPPAPVRPAPTPSAVPQVPYNAPGGAGGVYGPPSPQYTKPTLQSLLWGTRR